MWENILQELSKTYQISLKLLIDVKYHVAQFVQLDLGLESHLQLVLSITLLLLVYSETRTIISLEVMFEEETLMFMPTNIALTLSITWSLYSCISAHLEGISKKRQHTTFKSTSIILRGCTLLPRITKHIKPTFLEFQELYNLLSLRCLVTK